MEVIQGTANISTTECGHTFHHQCLYKWHRIHTNCPLCRKEFGDIEEDQYGIGRTGTVQQLMRTFENVDYTRQFVTLMTSRRLDLQHVVARHHEELPLEEFTGEIEERDIRLVAQQAEVSYEMARRYLRYYHGDIVNAIMYLTEYKEDLLIPPFRRRIRPDLPEPYEKRSIRDRLVSSRRKEADTGYESA